MHSHILWLLSGASRGDILLIITNDARNRKSIDSSRRIRSFCSLWGMHNVIP